MYLAQPIFLVRKGKEDSWLDPIFFSESEAQAAANSAGLDPASCLHCYPGKLGRFPSPMHPGWLAEMIRRHCIVPKRELEDGAWYIGQCRNANLAQWDAKRGVFVHWREKFEKLFPETIRHPEDDDGFDLFWPAQRVFPVLNSDDLRGKDSAWLFERYIGIDYSGAETPTKGLIGLQVYQAGRRDEPTPVPCPLGPGRKWTRKALAHWLAEQLTAGSRTIVGIDHAFSFPESYFKRYGLGPWSQFLEDFCKHWPTDEDNTFIDLVREGNPQRVGKPTELRMTDRWCSSAQSVFRFDGQGTVGKSSHAGIPWLRFLRRHENLKGKLHFWPFDGFKVPDGRSAIVEVYPSIFRRRYPKLESATVHSHDAYAVVRWLQQMDDKGLLGRYFAPPLTEEEQLVARREGWILGVA